MSESSKLIKKPVIIVADSDPGVRDLVGRYVSEQGYDVSYATTGYEALDSARKDPPLAIFADLLLPRLDGLALCRLIKSDPVKQIQDVEIVVLSVLPAEKRAIEAGARLFIKKPLEKGRVISALEETAKHRGVTPQ